MISHDSIRKLAAGIAEQVKPQRIILFGSYAHGNPTPDSDVDLLIIMPHKHPPAVEAAKIRRKIKSGFPVDILVRSASEIRRRLKMGDMFIKEIIESGQPIYEGHNSRVDKKGRS